MTTTPLSSATSLRARAHVRDSYNYVIKKLQVCYCFVFVNNGQIIINRHTRVYFICTCNCEKKKKNFIRHVLRRVRSGLLIAAAYIPLWDSVQVNALWLADIDTIKVLSLATILQPATAPESALITDYRLSIMSERRGASERRGPDK